MVRRVITLEEFVATRPPLPDILFNGEDLHEILCRVLLNEGAHHGSRGKVARKLEMHPQHYSRILVSPTLKMEPVMRILSRVPSVQMLVEGGSTHFGVRMWSTS